MKNSWGGRWQRKNKYNNQKIKADGFTFDSDTEYQRYLLLKDMAHQREILDLVIKPGFILEVNDIRITARPFQPDFSYRLPICPAGKDCFVARDPYLARYRTTVEWDPPDDDEPAPICPRCCIVEDVKGYMDPGDSATKIFQMKCRLVLAIYGIEIKVVQNILAKRRQEAANKNKKEKRRLEQMALLKGV